VITEQGIQNPPTLVSRNLRYVYQPIPLDAKKYLVEISRQGMVPGIRREVDLRAVGSVALWLDDPSTVSTAEVASFTEAMAADALAVGAAPEEVERLAKLSEGARAVAKRSMRPRATPNPLTANADTGGRDLLGDAIPPPPPAAGSTQQEALDLKSSGNFGGAALLYRRAATEATSDAEKRQWAIEAYHAFVVAGNDVAAKDVRNRFKVAIDPAIASLTDKRPAYEAANLLRSLGISISGGAAQQK